jgi:NDP-sugar pyrophosphorylase family protein
MSSFHDSEVLILAGGFGTRLKGISGETTKPMVLVQGRPFLEFLVHQVKSIGLSRVAILTGYGAEQIRGHFGDGSRFGLKIRYSHEERPLGTGGAIRQAIDSSEMHKFLALNGDSYLNTDLSILLKRARPLISLALTKVPKADRFGAVQLDRDGRIMSFLEKRQGLGEALINAGIYVMERAVLPYFPEGASSIEKDVFPKMVAERLMWGVECGGQFIDIGTPESFAEAQSLPIFGRA